MTPAIVFVGKITDEQKQLAFDAGDDNVLCIAEEIGPGKWCGLVNIPDEERGVTLTIARTDLDHPTKESAVNAAEEIVEVLYDEVAAGESGITVSAEELIAKATGQPLPQKKKLKKLKKKPKKIS